MLGIIIQLSAALQGCFFSILSVLYETTSMDGKMQNVWENSEENSVANYLKVTWLLACHIYWCAVAVIVLKGLYEAWKDLGEEECCPARKTLTIKAVSQEQMTEKVFFLCL